MAKKKFGLVLVSVILILTACTPASTPTEPPEQALETPEPTQPVESEPETDVPTFEADTESYKDLSFDDYLEITYRDLKLRSPEVYVQLGLESIFGVKTLALDNVSYEFEDETSALYKIVLDGLTAFDFDNLSPDQQKSYVLYQDWLEEYLQGDDFKFNFYIDSGFDIVSASANTEFFFSDILVLEDLDDAEDYLVRLGGVGTKIDQVSEKMEINSEEGIIPPQILFQRLIDRVSSVNRSSAKSTSYYKSLKTKLDLLDNIDDSTKEDLLARAEQIITDQVKPAYQNFMSVITELNKHAPQAIGLYQYPNGEAYYQYLLNVYTTTDLTADEIYNLGMTELDRVHAEMRALFSELGYPEGETLEALYSQAAADSGYLSGAEILPGYEAIITDAEAKLGTVFDTLPQQEVIVIGDNNGGFYVPGTVDGSRPGAFYAATVGQVDLYTMPTLTYHETIPGHHLQLALAQEMDLPTFRRVENSTGYVEGWALYAERLVYELGWYEDNPLGDLGRLQYEAFRAARLVVDTGVHALGWDFNRAATFFAENTGFPLGMAQGQIYRYIAYPGQATAYMVGMLKILELRDVVQQAEGEDFDIKAFHNLILNSGSMPLDILEAEVLESIGG
jgi:uncharacterized protein (DUF885 family)